MSAHIKVFIVESQEWIPWCQAPVLITEGTPAKAVIKLHDDAHKVGVELQCGHPSVEEAERMIDFLKEQRPQVKYKIVEGQCDYRERDARDYLVSAAQRA